MEICARKFTFPISIDPSTFNQMETARGTTSRSAFVRDAIRTKLSKTSV